MTTNSPKHRRWLQFRLRTLLITLGCLLLVIAVVIGIKTGRIGLRGRPIQRIQELQAPSEERNRQIDEFVNP